MATNWFLYFSSFTVNLLAFSLGIGYSWTSPVLPMLNSNDTSLNPLGQPTTPYEDSIIVSFLSLGAASAPFLAGYLAHRFGRKKTLILSAVPMLISNVMCVFASTVYEFYVARLLIGFGIGCTYCVVPMYIGEIAQDSNRGQLGFFLSIATCFGNLCVYCIGPYVSIKCLSILCIFPPAVFLIVFTIFIPESPYFYLYNNREKQAKECLRKLRNAEDSEILKELEIIKYTIEQNVNKGSILDLFKSASLRKGISIMASLMVFHQFAGILVVISYMQTIFEAANTNLSPELSVIIIGCIQFVTVCSASLLVDRLGRKKLLLPSFILNMIALFSLGLYFHLKDNNYDVQNLTWLPIVSLVVFIIGFNGGIGSIAWAIMGELFPQHLKSIAASLCTFICLFLGFLITMFFPYLAFYLGMSWSFWFFSIFCFIGTIFVFIFVPETKGKSLQEIQNMLAGDKLKDGNDDSMK